MNPLKFPFISPSLKKDRGQTLIFDPIRKKHVVLTPEEWVRQHCIHYLIDEMHYPKALFSIEKALTYNTRKKRFDILIYDRNGHPWMLIECKSSTTSLKQETLNQILVYNMTVHAKYLSITNGMACYCWHVPSKNAKPLLLDRFPHLST